VTVLRAGTFLAALSLVLLAACSKPDNAAGPGGVTVGEAKALDAAAEKLDANRTPEGAAQQAVPQQPQDAPAPG
jgi:hypothetical protein